MAVEAPVRDAGGGVVAHTPKMTAYFTMVARHPVAQTAAPVHRLAATTPAEEALLTAGKARGLQRRERSRASLDRVPPTEAERLLVHELYLQTLGPPAGTGGADAIPMAQTVLEAVRVCQPQEQNIHQKIFGGFLLREAFELAWANAYLLAGAHPYFLALDDVTFHRPVEIGSLLHLTATVAFAPGAPSTAIQTRVRADVVHPATRERHTTNVFHFTFTASSGTTGGGSGSGDGGPARPRTVRPQSYAEAMEYLDGRRRLRHGGELAAQHGSQLARYFAFTDAAATGAK